MRSRTARNLMYSSFGASAILGIGSLTALNYDYFVSASLGAVTIASLGIGSYFRNITDVEEVNERNYSLMHSLEDITKDTPVVHIGNEKRTKVNLKYLP